MLVKMSNTISGGKLTNDTLDLIKKAFGNRLTAIASGITWVSVTPSGGVHYTGKRTEMKCIFFELKVSRGYVVVALYEYPKGVIVHFFDPDSQIGVSPATKQSILKVITEIVTQQNTR